MRTRLSVVSVRSISQSLALGSTNTSETGVWLAIAKTSATEGTIRMAWPERWSCSSVCLAHVKSGDRIRIRGGLVDGTGLTCEDEDITAAGFWNDAPCRRTIPRMTINTGPKRKAAEGREEIGLTGARLCSTTVPGRICTVPKLERLCDRSNLRRLGSWSIVSLG